MKPFTVTRVVKTRSAQLSSTTSTVRPHLPAQLVQRGAFSRALGVEAGGAGGVALRFASRRLDFLGPRPRRLGLLRRRRAGGLVLFTFRTRGAPIHSME